MKKLMTFLLSFCMIAVAVPVMAAEQTSADSSEKEAIEKALNLANNEEQTWTYSSSADAWTLSIVSAVAYPVIADEEGVSVCVPGAYVKGIDTDGDGTADVTASEASGSVNGSLVIDYEASVTSTNGQIYTAASAPVILNTGAAEYGNSSNTTAGSAYAEEGYINVACGNRGKQDSYTDEDGNTVYTGDAPSCLADQKAAARFVRYNILLGNLPGSTEYWVSTGGSGGGAHAAMFAATGDHEDFYDYQIEVGAVGVYKNEDGSYSTSVTIDGEEVDISDGAWGCVAYSAITSLYEGDMTLAFEYYLDADYEFNTPFQKELASCLAEKYMEYINGQNLKVQENQVGFDLNGDGDQDDAIALTIEYDPEAYPETRGYYGTYLDLYLAEFTENLQWYLDNLDYAEGWTWFDENGSALSDEETAAMTTEDKAAAFIEGRYAKSSGNSSGGPGGGGAPDGSSGGPDGSGGPPDGSSGGPDGSGESGSGPSFDSDSGSLPDQSSDSSDSTQSSGDEMEVGTPDAGTTQAAGSSVNSSNYSTYEEMLASYEEDITEVYAGDRFGKNQVSLYNPLNYIGAEGTSDPAWSRILMGAAEGDMSMFASLNLQLAWLNAGTDSVIEWQWDGGHVPSEILGDSLALYVDEMYGKHVEGAQTVEKEAASPQTSNGSADAASGTDLSGWVDASDIHNVSFTLADAAAYRTDGASKAVPGFDVIDYGQEDYVFGSETADARHWDIYVLEILKEHSDVLSVLFQFFEDVSQSDYYYDAVVWAVSNGVTTGTSSTAFSPDQSCTRGQMVTFLWRAAGSPEAGTAVNPFTDVSEDDYYYDAVLWAAGQGIAKGMSETAFEPDSTVSRAQAVTFLYRAHGSAASDAQVAFTDVTEDAYYYDAVKWAVEKGVTTGTSADTFSPDSDCLRAQIVTFLYRAA